MIYRLSNVLLPILLLFLYVSSEVKSCDLFFSLEALISPQKANCRSTLPDGSIGNYRCKASNCITTGNLYKLPAGRPYITFRKCKDTRTGKFEDVTYPNSYSLVGNHYYVVTSHPVVKTVQCPVDSTQELVYCTSCRNV